MTIPNIATFDHGTHVVFDPGIHGHHFLAHHFKQQHFQAVATAVSDPRNAYITSKALKVELLLIAILGNSFGTCTLGPKQTTISNLPKGWKRKKKQMPWCIQWRWMHENLHFFSPSTSRLLNKSSHGCCINGLFGQGGPGFFESFCRAIFDISIDY